VLVFWALRVLWRGSRIEVVMGRDRTRYRLLEGPELTVTHHGTPIAVTAAPLECLVC
jgi:alpha,alpha-trehalose phosphorylase